LGEWRLKMVIDVRLVPEGHSEIERESALSEFLGDLPPLAGPVLCRAGIDRMGGVIAAAVRFAGAFELECARCLERYVHAVEGGLRVIIREEQGKFGQSFDDGADFYFDVNHDLVDISSAIYDEVMTALPLKPLCSEDCAGVEVADSGFGVEAGTPEEKPVDPRWEGLRKLGARV